MEGRRAQDLRRAYPEKLALGRRTHSLARAALAVAVPPQHTPEYSPHMAEEVHYFELEVVEVLVVVEKATGRTLTGDPGRDVLQRLQRRV